MDVHQAADLMGQQQIRRLPVVENGHVVGMVALGDIAVQDQFANEAEEALQSISTPSAPQQKMRDFLYLKGITGVKFYG